MKRKVIQIAESTQLISLPRKWSLAHNIKKGDELDVEAKGNQLVISTEKGYAIEKVELNIEGWGVLTQRAVHALYKKGVDEIRLVFSHPQEIETVQKALGKEAVGYEMVEHGNNFCVIRHVSGELEDFDPILRRAFLLLHSMAESTLEAIQKGEFDKLKNIALLEEANNRFTTSCRRFLNKKGYQNQRLVGSLYYIIEDLENLADQYKYLCNYLYQHKDKRIKIRKEILEFFKEVNSMLKLFYEVYYKFDHEKLVAIGTARKDMVAKAYHLFEKSGKNPIEMVMMHHLMVMMQKIFGFIGPLLVMQL